ncbi:type II secretion system F family protein [Roseimaritima ulvae]|uniref:Bacterial type II secretion system protein F domain protein n=1 Tax=Roseimaritima ulvae TaxID=980254 RepID=A0A5B9QRD7_9BACT|nr:type II secretion system F family protein [Roseimaritima ulvae]QEG39616.1 Bacterial type II secretion system protein F domain protein [Roseimaritima ulvae]
MTSSFVSSQVLGTVGVFATVSLAMYCLMRCFDPYWFRIRCRVSDLTEVRTGAESVAATSDNTPPKHWVSGTAGKLAELLPGADHDCFHARLTKAGIHRPSVASRLNTLRLLLTSVPAGVVLIAALAAWLPLVPALFAAFFLAGIGYLLPSMWLNRAVHRYQLMLRNALPDFLDLVVVCLDAGLSLQESVKRVGEELRFMHPSFAFELEIVQRDIELGSSVDRALQRFASRTDYDAVRTLSTLIREGQKFGTNVSEALRGHSEMLRLQREHTAEENAQKASVKIILPTMVFIFPAIFIVLVSPAAFKIQEAFVGK